MRAPGSVAGDGRLMSKVNGTRTCTDKKMHTGHFYFALTVGEVGEYFLAIYVCEW